jgi:predicted CopG family antitoxin
MGTTTISLERSAYELLKSQKRNNESFSEELHRLLGSNQGQLRSFLELISEKDGRKIAAAVDRLRAEDLALARKNLRTGGARRGRRA